MKQIYLEFQEHVLLLSTLEKKETRFFFNNTEIIKHENLEIHNGSLCNPSALYLKIKAFLQKHQIKKAKAIVCIPTLNTESNNTHILKTLQFALCTSKTGLIIKKIIATPLFKKENIMAKKHFFSKKDLNTQLDFFKKLKGENKNPPGRWILQSFIIIFFLSLTLIKIHRTQKTKLSTLRAENKILLAKKAVLNERIKTMEQLREQNKLLTAKIKKIKKIQTNADNPSELLLAITKNLPEKCWLTHITIDAEKLEIEGLSFNQKDITLFAQNFKKDPCVKTLHIKHVAACTQDEEFGAKYSFKLRGKINKQS